MVQVSYDVNKFKEIIQNFIAGTKSETLLMMDDLGQMCVTAVKPKTPKGVGSGGGLMGSIYAKRVGAEVWVSAPKDYAQGVEEGTKPHSVDPEDLIPWVRIKIDGNKDMDDAERTAKSIANYIGKWGTQAQPYMMPGCEEAFSLWKFKYGA